MPNSKFLTLDVTPEQIPEDGTGIVVAQATDLTRPENETIECLFTAGTGSPPFVFFLPNAIPFVTEWTGLSGPPGIECLMLQVTWFDTTISSVQDCIDYTS